MSEAVVWSIAGSDPSGGAGIQADLKTFQALGVYGCAALTAVIAQNTTGVKRVEAVADDMLRAQLDALAEDMPPRAIKIGMLGTASAARIVAEVVSRLQAITIYDPVMGSGDGYSLMEASAEPVIKAEWLPRVDILTPNIGEAERLTGCRIATPGDMEDAARLLRAMGPRAVLLKGGHMDGGLSSDLWMDEAGAFWLNSARRSMGRTHGTGCTLSSAMAACAALGFKPRDAVTLAKAYINQALRTAPGVGQGRTPLAHGGWPAEPADMPWITDEASRARGAPFPDCGTAKLGFYPIVSRAGEVKRMLSAGARTIQLRAKDLHGMELEREIVKAVDLAVRYDARLFINDAWRLAIEHRAYGVHLGFDDWAGADMDALRDAGLRVGLSAYTYEQLAHAVALNPSYIGLGAIFATDSKDLRTAPLGVEGFRRMRRLVNVPVVAIGGVTLERAGEVLNAGADGLAVISDVARAPDPARRAGEWTSLMKSRTGA